MHLSEGVEALETCKNTRAQEKLLYEYIEL
jgi:hypothetical protein